MDSLSLPTLPRRLSGQEDKDPHGGEEERAPRSPCWDLVVASFGDPVANDYADYASSQTLSGCKLRFANLSDPSAIADLQAAIERGPVAAIVVFLKPAPTASDRRALDDLLGLAAAWQTEFIGIVSTCQVHLGNALAADAEACVVDRPKGSRARTVVFRPGHVLSNNSRASLQLRRFGFSYPLVPRRFRGCCINADEFFAALEEVRQERSPRSQSCQLWHNLEDVRNERSQKGPRPLDASNLDKASASHNVDSSLPTAPRVYTLLGPNLPWREWLAKHRQLGLFHACLTAASALLSLLCLGHLAGILFALLAWRWPSLRQWTFDTLYPCSFGELLALYNPYNYRHVKVVGYNNGVIHFGQRFPGKTVVSTANCHRVVMTGRGSLKADGGATVRKALDFLAASGKELPVVPNYSYVCLGTSFFVPIHGSAGDFSTIADTITRVLLYDPARDQIITATRHEPGFQDHAFNQTTDVLLLRLYLQVKPKSRYFVRRETLQSPLGSELLSALRDNRATNVEIRKSHASSPVATVSRYYNNPSAVSGPLLELPRDTLGRLWDRLEENPVTSFLMHALTRHFAWHLELFFTADEFAVFWETHRTLPLRKIQLRYIRRDGLPHSPFRDHDCVAVDLFMFRRHRRRFEAYLKKTFAVVRTNPGKHSR